MTDLFQQLHPMRRSRQWITKSALRLYVVFVVLASLPILMFSYFADRVLSQEAERQAVTEDSQIAELSAVLISEHFRQSAALMQAYAIDPEFQAACLRHDLGYIQQHMERAHALEQDSLLVSVYDLSGTMIAISPLDKNLIGNNYSYRDWYKGLAQHWTPYVSEVYRTTAVPQALSVAVAVPIKTSEGKPIGIIATAYSLERISTWLRQVTGSGGRNIFVVDQNGHVLASPGINILAPPVDLSSYEPVRRVLREGKGSGRFRAALGNSQVYVSFIPVRGLGWGVLVEQPSERVQQHVMDVRKQAAFFAAVFFALALGSGALIANLYRNQKVLSEQVVSLTDSEARYRSLIQGATYGIYRSDENGFISVNPAMVSMLGYSSEEEVMSLNLSHELYVNPEDRTRLIDEYRRTQRVGNTEVHWKKRSGAPITVRLSGRTVLKENGTDICFEMIAEDITERRALEEQLRQSQKMEAIGRLAGGVAHDFNNLLTVISGYNEMTIDALGDDHASRPELEEIRKATDRASGLTRQLLAFSRQQVLEAKVLDLNTVVASMDNLLRRLLGEDIEFISHLAHNLGSVKADPGQIGQVIMNLAVNARDAMSGNQGGKITLETANVKLDAGYARQHLSFKPGSYVMLAVSDTGAGMDPETQSHIFEPFFTTKPQGSGTGLGLSTVYGIVKQSGGYIWVYSEIGLGTTFKVYLPRVDAESEESITGANRPTKRGVETVLLVEDEEGVRALTRHVLKRSGYTVLEARDGVEALAISEEHGKSIDLLLTDVVLQHMSGREIAQQILKTAPGMRVLYMSGYTDDAVLRHGILTEETFFLQKPFTTDGLIRKVREVLDAPVV
ncbi:MAG: multi-sensor hybrid histidine kinase [Acidobacteriales bacterium]|nr:multi-sensor hybrid histidine kinase [Terriglobales bacterium]